MQPSTVPSLGPSLSTSVNVEAVAPTATVLSSSAEACIVGEETTPIPARLVRLIQAQEYVDFAELLPDNLELLRRMQATAEPANRRRLPQITTLPTWVQCIRRDSSAKAPCPGAGSDGVLAACSARSAVPQWDRLAVI